MKVKLILTSKSVRVALRHDRDYTFTSVVLVQEKWQGVQRNVAYLSRKLLRNDRSYSVNAVDSGMSASCVNWHHHHPHHHHLG